MTDISIPLDGYRVNLRVGAIVGWEDKVLLCQLPGQDFWFLPGGRIKVNESSKEALSRELKEEVGEDWIIKGSVLFSENFFTLDDEGFHENCVYYEVEWTGDKETEQMRRSGETFIWVERDQLKEWPLLPAFLVSFLNTPETPFRHSISRDGEPEQSCSSQFQAH